MNGKIRIFLMTERALFAGCFIFYLFGPAFVQSVYDLLDVVVDFPIGQDFFC